MRNIDLDTPQEYRDLAKELHEGTVKGGESAGANDTDPKPLVAYAIKEERDHVTKFLREAGLVPAAEAIAAGLHRR